MCGDIAVVTYNNVVLIEVVLFKLFSMDKFLFTGFLLANEPPLAVMFIVSSLQVTLQIFLHGVTTVAAIFCAPVYFLCVYTKIFMKFYAAANVILKDRIDRLTPASLLAITRDPSLSCEARGIVLGLLRVAAIGTLSSSPVLLIRALIVIFNMARVHASCNMDSSRQTLKLCSDVSWWHVI